MSGEWMKDYLANFLLLLMLFIPFQFSILPSFGIFILPFSELIIAEFGTFLFPNCTYCLWLIGSDNAGIYLLAILLLPLVLLVQVLFKRCTSSPRLFDVIRYLLLLYLSMQLMRYGLDKVFLNQFGFPEANLLYTPIGNMEKDILFWTCMGSSPLLSIVTGATEVLVGLALLFKQTRIFALMTATLILFHIFLLNISFQIDVRFYSFFLFSIGFLLSLEQWKTLIKSIQQGKLELDLSTDCFCISKWAKALLVTLIFLDLSFPHLANGEKALAIPAEISSAYQCNESDNQSGVQRIFFHSQGYIIFESENALMTSEKIYFDPVKKLILFEDETSKLSYQIKGDTLSIHGINGEVQLDWQGIVIDLESLSLVKDKFSLTSN
jgi:uncharacterized membrane protein YphA (DoxX/SURF4 family)